MTGDEAVHRRRPGRRRREGQGAVPGRARPATSGSSRWPRASATSTPRSTRATDDVAQARSGRASTASSRRSGSRAPPRALGRSPTSSAPTSASSQAKVAAVELPAGADRQRRGRAARRGLEVEDHRRGGALLAHRPRRLRRPTSRARSARSTRCARRWPSATPALADGDRRAASRPSTRARALPRAATASCSYTALTTRRRAQALAGRRRARRAAVAGRRRTVVAAMSRRTAGAHAAAAARRRRRGRRRAGRRRVAVGRGAPATADGRRAPTRPVRRRAPGRDRHAGAGPAAFAAFDVDHRRAPDDLRELLRTWTAAAARMTAGEPRRRRQRHPLAPPDDTGEAVGLRRARLTITFGFGPVAVRRRAGSASARSGPAALQPTARARRATSSTPARSGGDLCVQACADDPQVAFHAVRNLARIGRGVVVDALVAARLRPHVHRRAARRPRRATSWASRTARTTSRLEDTDGAATEHVWVGAGDEPGAGCAAAATSSRAGSGCCIEVWDRATLADQEADDRPRARAAGAPLGASEEFDPSTSREAPTASR